MNKFLLFSFVLGSSLLTSCSLIRGMGIKSGPEALNSGSGRYRYTDKGIQYSLVIDQSHSQSKSTYSTKKVMRTNVTPSMVVEQSIAISDVGSLKKDNLHVLRPKISQFNIWFDKQKYASEIKLNSETRTLDIKLNSPESQWNGIQKIPLNNTSTSLPCFFTQVIQCAQVSGFIKKASLFETGRMNVTIIWEGYPYWSEVYSNFPQSPISQGELVYDGKLSKNERRFVLNVENHSIIFILGDKDELQKMLWVSEGVSMIHNKLPRESTEE